MSIFEKMFGKEDLNGTAVLQEIRRMKNYVERLGSRTRLLRRTDGYVMDSAV